MATEDPAPDRRFDNDARFHDLYVEAAAGPRLTSLYRTAKAQAERYARVYVSLLVDGSGASLAEHRAIVRAIDEGSPEAARDAAGANWRNAAERLAGAIEKLGERGAW